MKRLGVVGLLFAAVVVQAQSAPVLPARIVTPKTQPKTPSTVAPAVAGKTPAKPTPAADAGVAALRMPTDAECLALGAPKTPLSFGPGEVLEYDLDALGAKAGKMTMRVLPQKDGLMPIEVKVETNTFFNKIRKVTGTGTSYLGKTLRPARYYEDANENDIRRVADVTFAKNRKAKLVSTIDGQSSEMELTWGSNDATDVAGAIFLLRQLPLKEGKVVCFDAYGIRRMWRVWGVVQPREHASIGLGEFEAWHLSGNAVRTDFPDMAPRQIHVWISDDAKRLPLAALGTIDLGAVRATLTAVTRPGDKPTQAENKANLKW